MPGPASPEGSDAGAELVWLRVSVAVVWGATGLLVLHPAYRAEGAAWLARLGLDPWIMGATCAGEVLLALRVALRPVGTALALLQAGAILTFTAILAVLEPSLLVHPFGVLTKNVPLLAVIGTVWIVEREGWTLRAAWLLRAGVAVVWITEGLGPKVLWPVASEVRLVEASGLAPGDPRTWLAVLGLVQAAAGVATLLARGRLLRRLLQAEAVALVVLPLLVTWQVPEAWLHPFGPFTKNVPILCGTVVCARLSAWRGTP